MRSINLIPLQRRIQRRARLRLRTWTFALIGAVALMALACGLLRARVPAAAANGAELDRLAAQISELNASLVVESRSAADRELNRDTLMLLRDQPDWSLLLELLAANTDQQSVLREIRLTPVAPAPALPNARPAAKTALRQIEPPSRFKLELRGLCKSPGGVSKFVESMERTKVFSDVKLVRTGREPFLSGIASSFELECTLGRTRGEK